MDNNLSLLTVTSSYLNHIPMTNPSQSYLQNVGTYVSNHAYEGEIYQDGKEDEEYEKSMKENVDKIYQNLNHKLENEVTENINESFKKTENIEQNTPTKSKVLDSNSSIDSNTTDEVTEPGKPRVKRRRGSCSYQNVFLCKFCDQAYIEEEKCKDHEILDHNPTTPFSCRQCGDLFAERNLLIRHTKYVHENDRAYQCMSCEKAFVRRAELRKHALTHTGVAPFQCNFCLKCFTRNTNLSKHLRIHTGEKPHSCPVCLKRFIFKADLQRHLLVHSKIKPYSCHICGRCYARKDKLVIHVGKHFEEENKGPSQEKHIDLVDSDKNVDGGMTIDLHPPDVTGKTLGARKPKLIRDIICEHCPKKFYSMDMYKSHLTTHTGENNFICPKCPKSFSHKWQLERHKIIHEDIKPLFCSYCNKGFGRKDKLKSHIKLHTK